MNQTKYVGKVSLSIRRLTMTALLAAMITVSICAIHIPVGTGGIVHFGDAVIYLAACLLPMPYAILAASIGGGLANLYLGLFVWAPFTMIIKPLTTLCFKKDGKLLCVRNAVALVVAAVITLLGYYIAEALIYGNWFSPVVSIPGNLIQSGGSAIAFVLIAAAFDRINIRSRLGLN